MVSSGRALLVCKPASVIPPAEEVFLMEACRHLKIRCQCHHYCKNLAKKKKRKRNVKPQYAVRTNHHKRSAEQLQTPLKALTTLTLLLMAHQSPSSIYTLDVPISSRTVQTTEIWVFVLNSEILFEYFLFFTSRKNKINWWNTFWCSISRLSDLILCFY